LRYRPPLPPSPWYQPISIHVFLPQQFYLFLIFQAKKNHNDFRVRRKKTTSKMTITEHKQQQQNELKKKKPLILDSKTFATPTTKKID